MSESRRPPPKKLRLDVLITERGLTPSRERAQSLILAGQVLVEDVPVTKAGTPIATDAVIRIRGEDHPYVSRGGIKLAAALKEFGVDPTGKVALDIGASTGGFTHVLLLGGATRVFALDVGHNQMDWKIRQDPRVVVMEKVNARSLEPAQLGGQAIDLVVVDVSFISLDKILPPLPAIIRPRVEGQPDAEIITLIKPQFEVGRDKIGKGGIVSDDSARLEAIDRLTQFAETLGLTRRGLIESPITGTEGNKEYLALWKRS